MVPVAGGHARRPRRDPPARLRVTAKNEGGKWVQVRERPGVSRRRPERPPDGAHLSARFRPGRRTAGSPCGPWSLACRALGGRDSGRGRRHRRARRAEEEHHDDRRRTPADHPAPRRHHPRDGRRRDRQRRELHPARRRRGRRRDPSRRRPRPARRVPHPGRLRDRGREAHRRARPARPARPAHRRPRLVRPRRRGGPRPARGQPASCYRRCLEVADEHACAACFSSISTGAHRFPDRAARIAIGSRARRPRGSAGSGSCAWCSSTTTLAAYEAALGGLTTASHRAATVGG